MKGVFLFNQLNDLAFMNLDDELSIFVNKLAVKSKLIRKEEIGTSVDTNVIIQLFSPLVASQRFMSGEVVNSYHTIKCQDGLTYVFKEFSGLLAMAIGIETESETFLHRKLLVLHRLLTFLYGPVPEQIHAPILQEREKHWKFLSDVLEKWSELYQREQCFLVEALERLIVNKTLNTKCISLLSSTLNMLRSGGGEKSITHALLLVECKLLTLFSNRSAYDLDSSDILIMILLGNTVFPGVHSTLSDLSPLTSVFSESAKSQSSLSFMSVTEPGNSKGSSIFSRTQSSSSGSDARIESVLTNSLQKSSEEKTKAKSSEGSFDDGKYHEWTFLDDRSGVYWDTGGSPLHANNLSYYDNQSSFHGESVSFPSPSKGRVSPQTRVECFSGDSDTYRTFTAFLKTKICDSTPVLLHVINVLPGVVLIFVNELPKPSHATLITDGLSLVNSFRSVISRSRSTGLNTFVSSMDTTLKKFIDIQKKFKGVLHVERILKDIHTKWGIFKNMGLTSITHGNQQEHEKRMMRFDNVLSFLGERLKDLFRALFLVQRKLPPQAQQKLAAALYAIHRKVYEQLADYKEYLAIKSVRNVALTSYLEDFPGLVHFIYVDRKSNYMTAPSLHLDGTSDKAGRDTTAIVRDKVWQVVSSLQEKLSSGYTAVTSRDNNFYFSYFLWFEDAMGNPLMSQQTFRGDLQQDVPGILSGNFYRKLLKSCFPSASTSSHRSVCCYELLCVHMGLVPTQYVLSHCRKMAAMLWESTEGPYI